MSGYAKAASRGGRVREQSCPGCWLGCSVSRCQCGRGEALCAGGARAGQDGRRRPPDSAGRAGAGTRSGSERPPCGHRLKLPASAQIARMIGVVARDIDAATSRPPEQALACLLAGHGGYMSLRAIAAHERMTTAARDEALAKLCARGLAEIRDIAPCGRAAALTAEGALAESEWRAELDRACEEAAGALSPAEQQQLVSLLFKLHDSRSRR